MSDINQIQVTKRDGRKEKIDLNKIHRVTQWAAEELNVSVSQVELKSHIQFYEGIKTEDIHKMIIKSAADLISPEFPDYQHMAARLAIFHLRKIAYGEFTPPHLYKHIQKLTEMGKYDKFILENYTEDEINELNDYIDHWRDMNFAYSGVKQLEGKYLVQNRVTKQIYESPQMVFILISMVLFAKYSKETRMDYVKKFYDAVSQFKISLPTPIMAGLRTPVKQFSSCVLIESGDSLDSINATTSGIVKYISQKAGIGVNFGRIRALGSEIRGGDTKHTGVIPFLKLFQAATKSCSQGGVRGGAATAFYPLWHLEVENLLVLKNNKGVEDNRVRQLDYGVQINKYLYERLIKNQNITLFSPNIDGLYDAFFENQDEFARLYEKYENDPTVMKKTVKAIDLFSLLMQERASTGRIYIHNVDHTNEFGPFKQDIAPIRQSNLCLEIALPTKPLNNILDKEGEIALCTLSAINLGKINDTSELEEITDLTVRALDELLDYQNYPVEAAKISTMNRRPLGIGVINYAYYLAKNNVKVSDSSANNLTHKTFEAFQFYLLKASNKLAKEKGSCPAFKETKYAEKEVCLPIDRYKTDVDVLHNEPLHMDWDGLRKDIIEFGLRNSTLSAFMPSETSSQISNATNGIELPRSSVVVKASKDGILKQVVPEIDNLQGKYEYLWELKGCDKYIENISIIQKFTDQAISTNTFYDPQNYSDGKVPMKVLLKDLLTAYKYGLKTLYYHNTRDGSDDTQENLDDCESGACKI